MASSSSKSARYLSGIEGVSDRALSRVVSSLKECPDALSASTSRWAYGRQVASAIRAVGTVKHTIPLTKGKPLVWEVLALQDLLPHLCNASPPFCQLLGQIYSECGADWHAVLYCDGITPGAVLAADNSRKSIMWYATLLEFGTMLSHQELWSCIACIETAVSKLVPAQVSGLTRLLVKDMVCGDRASNVAGTALLCMAVIIALGCTAVTTADDGSSPQHSETLRTVAVTTALRSVAVTTAHHNTAKHCERCRHRLACGCRHEA